MTEIAAREAQSREAEPAPARPARRLGGRWGALRRPLLLLALQIALVVLLLVGWSESVKRGWVDPFFVSTPGQVGDFLWEFFTSGDAWPHIWATVQATFLGFAVGSLAGVVVGLLLSRFAFAGSLLRPFLTAFNALPRVALAPMFILWFGIGMASKVYLAVSLVFFVVLIGTEAAVKSVDRDLLTMARLMGASERQRYVKVVLPASVPTIFAALRLGGVYSLLGVVVGEMLAGRLGLGQLITMYSGTYEPAGVFGVMLILVLIALVLNGAMALLERRLMRWSTPA